MTKVNELLNEACEIITLLEDISGLSKHGYPDNSIESQVETFFKKITVMNEDTCPKCDQHPYSETDRHCPVCFDEIEGEPETCITCGKEVIDHSNC